MAGISHRNSNCSIRKCSKIEAHKLRSKLNHGINKYVAFMWSTTYHENIIRIKRLSKGTILRGITIRSLRTGLLLVFPRSSSSSTIGWIQKCMRPVTWAGSYSSFSEALPCSFRATELQEYLIYWTKIIKKFNLKYAYTWTQIDMVSYWNK